MVATSEKVWERFNGEVSFGTIYSKGNQSTQYNLGADTAYVRERSNAGANFDSTLSIEHRHHGFHTKLARPPSALLLMPQRKMVHTRALAVCFRVRSKVLHFRLCSAGAWGAI